MDMENINIKNDNSNASFWSFSPLPAEIDSTDITGQHLNIQSLTPEPHSQESSISCHLCRFYSPASPYNHSQRSHSQPSSTISFFSHFYLGISSRRTDGPPKYRRICCGMWMLMESASSPNSPFTMHPAFVRVFGTQGSMRFSSDNSISFIWDLLSIKEPLSGCP